MTHYAPKYITKRTAGFHLLKGPAQLDSDTPRELLPKKKIFELNVPNWCFVIDDPSFPNPMGCANGLVKHRFLR